AFLPLDVDYPKDRLAYMLEDAQVPVLITRGAWLETLPRSKTEIVCVGRAQARTEDADENPRSGVGPLNAAYVIYTSGSTGNPKGVVNTHGGICNRLLWMQQA